jgi:hypothetical protein
VGIGKWSSAGGGKKLRKETGVGACCSSMLANPPGNAGHPPAYFRILLIFVELK